MVTDQSVVTVPLVARTRHQHWGSVANGSSNGVEVPPAAGLDSHKAYDADPCQTSHPSGRPIVCSTNRRGSSGHLL